MRQASDEEHELERQKPGVKAAETTESQEQSNKVGQSQQPLLGRLPALVAAVIFVGVAIGAVAEQQFIAEQGLVAVEQRLARQVEVA